MSYYHDLLFDDKNKDLGGEEIGINSYQKINNLFSNIKTWTKNIFKKQKIESNLRTTPPLFSSMDDEIKDVFVSEQDVSDGFNVSVKRLFSNSSKHKAFLNHSLSLGGSKNQPLQQPGAPGSPLTPMSPQGGGNLQSMMMGGKTPDNNVVKGGDYTFSTQLTTSNGLLHAQYGTSGLLVAQTRIQTDSILDSISTKFTDIFSNIKNNKGSLFSSIIPNSWISNNNNNNNNKNDNKIIENKENDEIKKIKKIKEKDDINLNSIRSILNVKGNNIYEKDDNNFGGKKNNTKKSPSWLQLIYLTQPNPHNPGHSVSQFRFNSAFSGKDYYIGVKGNPSEKKYSASFTKTLKEKEEEKLCAGIEVDYNNSSKKSNFLTNLKYKPNNDNVIYSELQILDSGKRNVLNEIDKRFFKINYLKKLNEKTKMGSEFCYDLDKNQSSFKYGFKQSFLNSEIKATIDNDFCVTSIYEHNITPKAQFSLSTIAHPTKGNYNFGLSYQFVD